MEDDEEEPPELEQIDIEEERQLQMKKQQKQQEWLNSVKAANGEEKAPFIPWDDECELPKPDAEAISKRLE